MGERFACGKCCTTFLPCRNGERVLYRRNRTFIHKNLRQKKKRQPVITNSSSTNQSSSQAESADKPLENVPSTNPTNQPIFLRQPSTVNRQPPTNFPTKILVRKKRRPVITNSSFTNQSSSQAESADKPLENVPSTNPTKLTPQHHSQPSTAEKRKTLKTHLRQEVTESVFSLKNSRIS